MAGTNKKLAAAVEAYFTDLGRIRGTGGATGELSYHPALGNLLNAVGAALKPKVFCVGELAALLDPDTRVHGMTQAPPRPGITAIAVPATAGGRNMAGEDVAVTAGWSHFGQGDAVMPGQGRAMERDFSPVERATVGGAFLSPDRGTFDIFLNGEAFWRNVPAAIWSFRLGGYQVLKKWLSYRERDIPGRPLRPEEIPHFSETVRWIGAILLLTRPASPTSAQPIGS